MNESLLFKLLTTPASIDNDKKMREAVVVLARKAGAEVTRDEYGNIYATKGTAALYPCYAAHVDTVHRQPDEIEIRLHSGELRAYDPSGKRIGIGGDDKCGIYVAIQMLNRLPNCKAVFFRNEEQGGLGSANAVIEWFDDCAFVCQVDRQGASDVVVDIWGQAIASDEFEIAVMEIGGPYGRRIEMGGFTDVANLIDNGLACSAINLSCGYYSPHTRTESIRPDDLAQTEEFALRLADLADTQWPAPEPEIYWPSQQYDPWPEDLDGWEAGWVDVCEDCGAIIPDMGGECIYCGWRVCYTDAS